MLHPLARVPGVRVPDVPPDQPGWRLFRSSIQLETSVPASRLWWSGSQRVRVWLDGTLISEGPPRSDRERWPYVDVLLPQLEPGPHVLAAEVTWYGHHGGKGQIGGPPFWVSAVEHPALKAWNSGSDSWRCRLDPNREFWRGDLSLEDAVQRGGHKAIGHGQRIHPTVDLLGWQTGAGESTGWTPPQPISETHGNPWGNRPFGVHLIRSFLPEMERVPIQPEYWVGKPDGDRQSLPPGSSTRWIADLGGVHLFDPVLRWKGGAGSRITLTYAEVSLNREPISKIRDDSWPQGAFPGQQDRIEPVGSPGEWSPEWFRAARFLIVDLEVGDDTLELESLQLFRRGFPFEDRLETVVEDGKPWSQLVNVNRLTNRACSHETFFDCPCWEQAQFPGDTRIQSRHHYLVYNEDRLARKAIDDFAASITPSGLLRSHWPSRFEQVISTYSLQWMGMLIDYQWYRGKGQELAGYLPTARGILEWFLQRVRLDGLMGRVDEAPFIDWAFPAGCPEQQEDGGSSILTAMVSEACGWMAELEELCGWPECSPRWREKQTQLRDALSLCEDAETGLVRDTPQGGISVHAQVQAALAGFGSAQEAGDRIVRAMTSEEAIQVQTLYYRAHLMEALRSTGRQAESVEVLDVWFAFLTKGVTTWPENDREMARSDCHGWGCVPEVELVHSLFGLYPLEPGWKKIGFHPAVAEGVEVSLRMELPVGELQISRDREGQWNIHSPVPVVKHV